MHNMLKEIKQQPKILFDLININLLKIGEIVKDLKDKKIRFVYLLGRGSSDNACTLGKYLIEYINGIPCGLVSPSIFSFYNAKLDLNNVLMIGVSQSGKTAEILEVLDKAKKYGAHTIGITNVFNSDISKVAHNTIYLYADEEKSVPATKTYTAQIVSFYILSFLLADKKNYIKHLKKIPSYVEKIIKTKEKEIKFIAPRFRFADTILVLGRGLNYSTALETSLKLKECCYIKSEAMSASDFLHGPIAMMKEDIPVIIYMPEDPLIRHLTGVVKRLKEEFNSENYIISSANYLRRYAYHFISMPSFYPIFSPILYIPVGQLLAYYISINKGINPDQPRGLKKVTQG